MQVRVLHKKHPGFHNIKVVINFLDAGQTNLNFARSSKYMSRALNFIYSPGITS